MAMLQAGMSIIGGAVGAMGAMQEAEAAEAAHLFNAQVAARNQKIIKDQTLRAVEDQAVSNRRDFRLLRAEYGAAGIDLGGSPLDVMMDTALEQQLDKKRIRYKGKLAQIEERDREALERMGASAAAQAGQISAISSILGGVSGAVNAFSSGGFSFGGFGGGSGGGGSPAAYPSAAPANVPTPRPRPTVSVPTPRPRPTRVYVGH